jgi:hypothetical protein
MISGLSTSRGGDRLQESISFKFTKIMCRDIGLGSKNDNGQPATVAYDLGLPKIM